MMDNAQWLPIQAVEGLSWTKGAYYVEESGEAHRMDESGYFPSLYGDIKESGKYEPDINLGKEYQVEDPLKIFEALGKAGKSYGLGIYKPRYIRDGVLVAKKGRSDNRLLRFIRDYGLPIKSRLATPVRIGYVQDDLSDIGQSDIGRGDVSGDLRTTAAIAHLCWTLWEGLQELEGSNKQAKSEAITKLKSHLREINVSTLDLYNLPDMSERSLWTFFPNLNPTLNHGPCLYATFDSSDATAEETLLRRGVYSTISKVAQWYLSGSINLVLAPLDGEASPPKIIIRMNGLLSFLWMHFLHAVVGRGVPKFYLVQCRQDEGANGCGKWFYSESAKAGRCNECQTIINRVEQRIKRNNNLKGQKEQLIEEERSKLLQVQSSGL